MGGFRKSDIAFRQEQAKKLRLVRNIKRSQDSIGGLRQEVTRILSTTTAGIRETFGEEVGAACAWRDSVEGIVSQASSMEDSVEALEARASELEDAASRGAAMTSQLMLAVTHKGDEVARDVGQQLANTRTLVALHRTECSRWFPEIVSEWDQLLKQADETYDAEDYLAVKDQLDAIEASVSEVIGQCQELSEKQQSRLYLLRAVRQVCCNLGMRESAHPRYENQADPASRILMTVTSTDQGNIQFAISLDGIHTHGESEKCFRDLDSVSDYLAKQYGIGTKFRSPGEEEQPDLKSGRARRLRDEADAYRSA